MVEFHVHGSRAVISGVLAALSDIQVDLLRLAHGWYIQLNTYECEHIM